ncbi:hypothetical protein BLA29_014387 [Euroglyphus maynei]|uniref:Uncharacterized protein n=1 Tax=Euroglyphus maynei TaxID=6958 RepID=A0A1Y3B9C0_EURMA|nr:hypothetical protein BLA29_014387 [Euroglyphus maynei]
MYRPMMPILAINFVIDLLPETKQIFCC